MVKIEGTKNAVGRCGIHDTNRRNFSRRAMQGKIMVEDDVVCPYCHHRKGITNMSSKSPLFNVTKCAKCKKVITGVNE